MKKILVVSSVKKSKDLLISLCNEVSNYDIKSASSSEECKILINNDNFDLIIINSPLRDEIGEKLSQFINEKTNSSVLLIVKDNIKVDIIAQLKSKGIVIIEKPLNRIVFTNTVNVLTTYHNRFMNLIKEKEKLKSKISEIKLVDRAKCTLIEYLRMSEEQAHHYIEKQAMDFRLTKVEVAKNILKIYET